LPNDRKPLDLTVWVAATLKMFLAKKFAETIKAL
jgi:hypothetical protein